MTSSIRTSLKYESQKVQYQVGILLISFFFIINFHYNVSDKSETWDASIIPRAMGARIAVSP